MAKAAIKRLEEKVAVLEKERVSLFKHYHYLIDRSRVAKPSECLELSMKISTARSNYESKVAELDNVKMQLDSKLMQAKLASKSKHAHEQFLAENPPHAALIAFEKDGILFRKKKRPEYFFIAGMKNVAFITHKGRIKISAKYMPLGIAQKDRVTELAQMLEQYKAE